MLGPTCTSCASIIPREYLVFALDPISDKLSLGMSNLDGARETMAVNIARIKFHAEHFIAASTSAAFRLYGPVTM